MVLESGWIRDEGDRYELTAALPPLAIPSTLQDSLMARLDRLGTGKEVAQVGAALGRTFHYELLRAIASIDDRTLRDALAKLGESDLLHQRGVPPDATYIFKHALIQETAYQSMLVSRRQQLHTRIADTLVERFPETTGTQPEASPTTTRRPVWPTRRSTIGSGRANARSNGRRASKALRTSRRD